MTPEPQSLSTWLSYLEAIHPKEIELGLERVELVKRRLNLNFLSTRVVTVGGTNGKGTTCAFIEQACITSNQSVAVYSSPHLISYRERVRVNGQMLSEMEHCKAFAEVEKARQHIPLTYFEFGTLAALYLISQANVDIALLEVGLGGRLDAVNVIEPDLSVITTIALDHQDWLGNTREEIAVEKAGILRPNKPAIIGELDPPNALLQIIKQLKVDAKFAGPDFQMQTHQEHVSWTQREICYQNLARPNIPAQNLSTALAVLANLDIVLSHNELNSVIRSAFLAGRYQKIQTNPCIILDVAHNIQAVEYLFQRIKKENYTSLKFVCGMLQDKDLEGCLSIMQQLDGSWYIGDIDHGRGATASQISSFINERFEVFECDNIRHAFLSAKESANAHDLILVFGSFFTVSAVLVEDKKLESEIGSSVTK